jgi:hypothetical protein
MKHTDRRAAVLGEIAGALGAGDTLDFMAVFQHELKIW